MVFFIGYKWGKIINLQIYKSTIYNLFSLSFLQSWMNIFIHSYISRNDNFWILIVRLIGWNLISLNANTKLDINKYGDYKTRMVY